MEDAIQHLTQHDIVFKNIINQYGLPTIPKRSEGFETLVLLILEQQVSIDSAKATFLKLKEKEPDFNPEKLLSLSDESFRLLGVSRQKTSYIKALSTAILNNDIELCTLKSKTAQEVREELIKIKGIGNWTIDIYLMFCLQEPDLLPLVIDEQQINAIHAEMPALPRELFLKYTKEYGLSEYDAYILTDTKSIANYYETLLLHTKNYKSAANWLMGDVKSYLNQFGVEIDAFPIPANRMAELIALIDAGKVSTSIASQKIFPEMLVNLTDTPLQIAETLNLIQDSSEDGISTFIQEVIASNPSEIVRYKNGEKQLMGFLMGQLMKVSKGKADPKVANELLRKSLENL